MKKFTRKVLIDTMRFFANEGPYDFECDHCPLQDIPRESAEDDCSETCLTGILTQAAQMLEDDGMIMKALNKYGK